jgi:hypothetical protein
MSARLASEQRAAEEVGLDVGGKLPKPLPDCGKFDLRAIDAALDRISGLSTPANALDAWRDKHRAG